MAQPPPVDPADSKAFRSWLQRYGLLAIASVFVVVAVAVAAVNSGGTSGSGGRKNSGRVIQNNDGVQITSCSKNQFGQLDAGLVIANNSSNADDYVVTVAFESADGATKIDTGTVTVESIPAGQATTQDAIGTAPYNGRFTCTLADVRRTQSSV